MKLVSLFDDTNPVTQRAIEIMGGVDAVRDALDADHRAMEAQWQQDITAIGRILRAHLYVEHYMTEHLQQVNPRLGNLDEARLTFAQKVHLLDGHWNIRIRQLTPGIKQLNKIRNRLAHNLAADVTADDVAVFLAIPSFVAVRDEAIRLSNAHQKSNDPLDILDKFAEYAAHGLHSSSSALGKAWEQAIQEGK